MRCWGQLGYIVRDKATGSQYLNLPGKETSEFKCKDFNVFIKNIHICLIQLRGGAHTAQENIHLIFIFQLYSCLF